MKYKAVTTNKGCHVVTNRHRRSVRSQRRKRELPIRTDSLHALGSLASVAHAGNPTLRRAHRRACRVRTAPKPKPPTLRAHRLEHRPTRLVLAAVPHPTCCTPSVRGAHLNQARPNSDPRNFAAASKRIVLPEHLVALYRVLRIAEWCRCAPKLGRPPDVQTRDFRSLSQRRKTRRQESNLDGATLDVSWTSRSGRPKRVGGHPPHIAGKPGPTTADARQRYIAAILP